MSNSEFLASGKVAITPDFSQFRTLLRTGIQTEIKAVLASSTGQSTKALRTASTNLTKSANALTRANKQIQNTLNSSDSKASRSLKEEAKVLQQANKTLETTLRSINKATVKVLSQTTREVKGATKDLNTAIRILNRTVASKLDQSIAKLRVAAQAMQNADRKLITQAGRSLNQRTRNLGIAANALGSAGTRIQRGFGGSLRTGLGSPAGNANLARTVTHITNINKVTTQTTGKLLGLGSATAKLDSALLGLRTAIGSTAVIGLGAGALAAIALGKALRSLVGDTVAFERNLNTFAAVAGATESELARVSATAKQLGADITLPNVSAADAAQTMLELAKAGLSVQDSIDGARGTLQLAAAAGLDFAAATEIAASAINAFGLAGRDAGTVADVLANAANLAQGSIEDIGIALQQASAVGRQVGLSFQDTSTFLTILAQNGLKGSDAGTSLRTALIRLINPTKKASDEIERLGVHLRDAQGNLRVDVFQQFTNAMRGMSKEQRDQTLAMIGGQDALRAFAILGRQSTRVLSNLRTAMRNEGTAADVAAARTKGLGGAASALSSTLQTIGISIGSRVAPGFTDFTNNVTTAINAVSESEGVIAGLNSVLSVFGTALTAAGHAAQFAGPLLLTLSSALGSVANAIGGQQILVGVASFILLGKVLRSFATPLLISKTIIGFTTAINAARTAAATTAVSMALSSGAVAKVGVAFAGARAGVAFLATSLIGMINPITAAVVGVAALAAGIVYLATRASNAERAISGIAKASDDLADALERQKVALDGVSSSQRGTEQASLALERALLEERRARAALAGSDAGKGTIERRQLEIELKTAIDNSRFAQEDYNKAIKDMKTAQDEAGAAERERNANLQKLLAGQKAINIALQLGFISVSEYAEGLRKQAREEINSTNEAERSIGRRKKLLGDLLANQDALRKAAEDTVNRKQGRGGFFVSDEDFRKAKARLEDIKRLSKIDLSFILDPSTSAKDVGDKLSKEFSSFGFKSAEEFRKAFVRTLAGRSMLEDISNTFNNLAKELGATGGLLTGQEFINAIVLALKNGRAVVADAMSKLTQQAFSRANTLASKNLDLQIAGADDSALLANARQRLGAEQVVLAGLEAERDSGNLKGKALQAKKNEIIEKKNDVLAIMREIEQLEKGIAAEAKQKADDAKQARIDANQAIVDAFGRRTDQAEQAVAAAGLTTGIKDDIKFNIVLRNILQKQKAAITARIKNLIASGKATVEELKVLRDFLTVLNSAITSVQGEIRGLFAQQQQNQKDALQRLIDSATLDVEFFNTTEQVNKEIAAKRRLIALLKRAAKDEKTGSNAWKEYRNQIAATQKEIDELIKTKQASNDQFQKLSFEFLQAQQGFAANLFGNLIPQGATAGLVGNVSQATTAAAFAGPTGIGKGAAVGTDVGEAATVAASIGKGPTSSQMSILISVARSIAEGIAKQNARMAHPEANKSRVRESASQDAVGNY